MNRFDDTVGPPQFLSAVEVDRNGMAPSPWYLASLLVASFVNQHDNPILNCHDEKSSHLR